LDENFGCSLVLSREAERAAIMLTLIHTARLNTHHQQA
jgi:hypothetical protein